MRSVLTALCLFTSTAHAVPAQFTHQGRLLDADGAPMEDEATIAFRVTDSESGGTELWEETITVPLTNGFYSAVLGADEDNPLDTGVLSQAPVWLELQLDGEAAMSPRSPIHSVPYATMATVAEEVSGGPVDASQIAVDGIPIVNGSGEWVGPAPTVDWTDLEGVPEGFADGIDDDTDTVLTEDEVDEMVSDNGYAMASDLFSGSFLDLIDIAPGLADGDDDTVLSESEVEDYITNEAIELASDSTMDGEFISTGEHTIDTVLGESEVEAYITDDPIDLAAGSTIGGIEFDTPFVREVFRVHKNGVDQGGIITGGLTRVSWPTEAFDTGDGFADDRFTSATGGKYAFHAAVMFNELVHYDNMIALYKNDAMIAMENYFIAVDGTNSGRPTMTVSTILHLEPGDYVDIWVHQESSDTLTVAGTEYATYFTGHKVDI